MSRESITEALMGQARSLHQRGYTTSTGGNLSHRLQDGFLIAASNTCFGRLAAADFVRCDLQGRRQDAWARPPSKEAPFHAAIYRQRPDCQAVLHLHATAAIALSGLALPTDRGNVLPVVTSGAVTRVGRLPLLEYHTPGTPALADRVAELCVGVNAILLQCHGLITFAGSLEAAVDVAEEAEQNIRVWLLTGGSARTLDDEELLQAVPLGGAAIAPGEQRPALRAGARLAAGQAELL